MWLCRGRLLTIFSLLLTTLFASYCKAAKDSHGVQMAMRSPDVIPGRYIVRLTENGNIEDDELLFKQFYKDLSRMIGINILPYRRIPSTIFTATSFELPKGADPSSVLGIPNVEELWPVVRVPNSNITLETVGAASSSKERWSSHGNTNVQKLHRQGILGQGVVIAVLDTGIDYMHPALGAGIGPGQKIKGAYNFIEPHTKGVPPSIGGVDCHGHGTAVAGIIAAEDAKYGIVGVAPKATLVSYQIASCDGRSQTDNNIAAFVQAYEDGADIIQCSLGEQNGWSNSPWGVAASEIAGRGVFVTFSGGNHGLDGPFNAEDGSAGVYATAVGSVENDDYFTWVAEVIVGENKKRVPLHLRSGESLDIPPFTPVYATSHNSAINDDACKPLPSSTPNLAGFIVLVRMATCSMEEQRINLSNKGAKHILFYNNHKPYKYPKVSDLTHSRYAMTTAKVGEWITEQLAAKRVALFRVVPEREPYGMSNLSNAGRMSTTSTWGPTNDFYIKPEISAPGGFIFTTYPRSKGMYATLSGTSMASPYIAGVAALYISHHGKLLRPHGAIQLKNRIITSGNPIPWYDGQTTHPTIQAPVSQAGGGYIDAWKVVHYKTALSPGKIELNATNFFTPNHDLTVTNNGDSEIDYKIGHSPDPGVCTLNREDRRISTFPPLLSPSTQASFRLDPEEWSFSLGPKQSKTIRLRFSLPPPGKDDDLIPVYSGKIVVTGDAERLYVPYLGVRADTDNIKVQGHGFPFFSLKTKTFLPNTPEKETETFTLVGNDAPAFFLDLVWGTAETKLEVVKPEWTTEDWRHKPTQDTPNYVGTVPWSQKRWLHRERGGDLYFPLERTLTSDIILPDGDFKLVSSVLKLLGNPDNQRDWEVMVSPVFNIRTDSSHGLEP